MTTIIAPQVGATTFLVGAERSGTTLLRLMLDSHPELAFRYESEFFVDLMHDPQAWPDLDAYYEHLRTYRWAHDMPEIDRSLDYPSLVRSFLEQKRMADGKPRVGATVHKHFDRLLRIWPDARFVHLLRDGRDVARSCVQMGWYGNCWSAAEHWLVAERLWNRMVQLVPEERRIDVRYEDLVSDPVAVLTTICRFVGIDYHAAMLTYPERTTYQLPRPSHAFRWRDPSTMSPEDVQLVEARARDMLAARGYELSEYPATEPTPAQIAFLQLGNRVGIALDRKRRLGTRLWAESLLASRLPLASWRDGVRERVQAVQNAELD